MSLVRPAHSARRPYCATRLCGWYYFYAQSSPGGGVFAYHRFSPSEHAVVVLNFSDTDKTVTVPCPSTGSCTELVDNDFRTVPLEITATVVNEPMTLQVPSSYGYIFCTLQSKCAANQAREFSDQRRISRLTDLPGQYS